MKKHIWKNITVEYINVIADINCPGVPEPTGIWQCSRCGVIVVSNRPEKISPRKLISCDNKMMINAIE